MKISIITATYNSEATLQDCLDSVKGQSWPFIEHIIIDGASHDKTIQIAEAYTKEFSCQNGTAQLFTAPDNGLYDALNKGISKATGDIVGFVHSDDILHDNLVLERIQDAFTSANADAVYGDLLYVHNKKIAKVIRKWHSGIFQSDKLRFGWMPPHPALYLKREIYEKLGHFDLAYKISADYDLILRVFGTEAIHTSYIPHTVVRMRVGGKSNSSGRNMWQKSKEDYQILKRNHYRFPFFTLVCKNVRKVPQFF
jgi:glycosyltransferase